MRVLIKKSALSSRFFAALGVACVIALYFFVSLGSFYPDYFQPSERIMFSYPYSGWNFYNAQAFAFKKGGIAFPYEPSDKLKNFDSTYDNTALKKSLSHEKNDYIMDLSYYKGRYYMYFGITPILTFYLPFYYAAGKFIPDSVAVLFFSTAAFIAAFIILNKLLSVFAPSRDFVLEFLKTLALGLSSLFVFIISYPRVYEAAISSGVFFGLLSYLFLLFFLKNKNKSIFLFFSGLSAALAVGCRPFYVLAIFAQIFVFVDFKEIKSKYKIYVSYFVPIFIYAVFLAAYNYIRFDSPFEFGAKYQLANVDMYSWKITAGYVAGAVKNFLFLKPIPVIDFPYVLFEKVLIRNSLPEACVGLIYTAPFCAMAVTGFSYFKSKSIAPEYKKFTASIFLCGAMILLVVSSVGNLYRYMVDFSVYFIIPSIVFAFYYLETLKGYKKYIMRFFMTFTMLAAITFCCAILVSLHSYRGVNMKSAQVIKTFSSIF
jgi:hypothetical protein